MTSERLSIERGPRAASNFTVGKKMSSWEGNCFSGWYILPKVLVTPESGSVLPPYTLCESGRARALLVLVYLLVDTQCVCVCVCGSFGRRDAWFSHRHFHDGGFWKEIISAAWQPWSCPAQISLHGSLLQGGWVIDSLQLPYL